MIEINNRTRTYVDDRKVKKAVKIFLDKNNLNNLDVSIGFIGDKKMRKLNKEYRGKDQTTDVLSFLGEDNFLGELLINYAQIKRQARKFNNSTKQELIFILVHGLFHLMGDTDDNSKNRELMMKRGEKFIKENLIGN